MKSMNTFINKLYKNNALLYKVFLFFYILQVFVVSIMTKLQWHDTGSQDSSLEKEEKNKIFQKFYRIGNEDTRQTKGTGLGLFISQKIIIAHRGKISTKDNTPKGTIFEVELPLN